MKIKFEADSGAITIKGPFGEYTTDGMTGWRTAEVFHPALGTQRIQVAVDENDKIVDETIYDNILKQACWIEDEVENPDFAGKLRAAGGRIDADGGTYTLED